MINIGYMSQWNWEREWFRRLLQTFICYRIKKEKLAQNDTIFLRMCSFDIRAIEFFSENTIWCPISLSGKTRRRQSKLWESTASRGHWYYHKYSESNISWKGTSVCCYMLCELFLFGVRPKVTERLMIIFIIDNNQIDVRFTADD